MSFLRFRIVALALLLTWSGCEVPSPPTSQQTTSAPSTESTHTPYVSVRLDVDLSARSEAEKEMVPLLIEAAQAMDAIYWEQAYGNRDSLFQTLSDTTKRRAVTHNYGPWNRLRNNEPFVKGAAPRPPGANFYPKDASPDALTAAAQTRDTLRAPHTIVRRLPDGSLTALPYHLFFAESMSTAATRLQEAAKLTENTTLADYLRQRADALTTGRYKPSTRAWHTLQRPPLDLVIGPMDTGEDQLLGTKESAAAVVLQHAPTRSQRLDRLSAFTDRPATRTLLSALDLSGPNDAVRWAAYDALYVAGGANAGPKPTVLPLSAPAPPNAAARRLLLSNVLDAKADSLLAPTAERGLAAPLQSAVTGNALFDHTALQAWGQTLLDAPDQDTSPSAVLTAALPLALSLALGPLPGEENAPAPSSTAHHATVLADLLHTIRLDETSTRGRAALLTFNYLRSTDALRLSDDGMYAAAPDTLAQAGDQLARALNDRRHDASAAASFADQYGTIASPLRSILDRLDTMGLPRALAFEQGESVLRGLQPATAAR